MATLGAMDDDRGDFPRAWLSPLPEAIRRLRAERGWTQREMARRIAITPQTMSGWERGKTIPRFGRLERLAAVLGIPAQRFVETARDQAARRAARRLEPIVDRIGQVMRTFPQRQGSAPRPSS